MTPAGTPPSPIRAALRVAAHVAGCRVVGPWRRHGESGRWYVPVELHPSVASARIAQPSCWIVRVDHAYPRGEVAIMPARVDGVVETFPHQSLNWPARTGQPWRGGKLCLEGPLGHFGRFARSAEPREQADLRVAWHIERALAWLEAEARGDLMRVGDRFELPVFPRSDDSLCLAYAEDRDSFGLWWSQLGEYGTYRGHEVDLLGDTVFVGYFADRHGRCVIDRARPQDRGRSPKRSGHWWLSPVPLLRPPWAAPLNWPEVVEIARQADVDLGPFLQYLESWIADRKRTQVLLIGQPIPARVGESACEIDWRAIELPRIRKFNAAPKKKRKRNKNGRVLAGRSLTKGLTDKPLQYVDTENWSMAHTHSRGRYPFTLARAHVALIGCGALGSCIAELLARGGSTRLTLIDGDSIEIGNLCRHTATVANLDQNKAVWVAERLRRISPLIDAQHHDRHVPAASAEIVEMLGDADVIIDCTSEDDVLRGLGCVRFSRPKVFVSASFGVGAERIHAFVTRAHGFPWQAFHAAAELTIDFASLNQIAISGSQTATGCWNPSFPARADDVWLAASVIMKFVAQSIESGIELETWTLRVYEQCHDDEDFTGLKVWTTEAGDT